MDKPRESDYTPEKWKSYIKIQNLENLRNGYKVARDYEKVS